MWENVIGIAIIYGCFAWVLICLCSWRLHFRPHEWFDLFDSWLARGSCCCSAVGWLARSGISLCRRDNRRQQVHPEKAATAAADALPQQQETAPVLRGSAAIASAGGDEAGASQSQSPLTPSASWALVLTYLNGFLVATVTTRSLLLSFNARGDPKVKLSQDDGAWKAEITGYQSETLWQYQLALRSSLYKTMNQWNIGKPPEFTYVLRCAAREMT